MVHRGGVFHHFNSATALEPWRTMITAVEGGARLSLQFGHGVGAVENRSRSNL
jgi:hypothetical protein